MNSKTIENAKLKIENGINSPSSSLSGVEVEGVGCETARGSANLKTNSHSVLDTESPKNVPNLRFKEFSGEWVEKKLGDTLKIGSGRDYKHLKNGEIPVYGTGGYMLSVDDYLYDGQSVCIGRKGTIDKPMFLNGKFWTVDTLFYTHSFNGSIPKFIYLVFQNISWKIYNEASGVPSLSKTTIEKIKINLPTLPEQQKIADCLSTWDDSIENLKSLIENKKLYKKGMMQKIFSQEIRFKPDTSTPLSASDGSDFPAWVEKKLGEVLEYEQPTKYIVQSTEYRVQSIALIMMYLF